MTPFLWFDNNAEEAANFSVSVFENAEVTSISSYGEGGPGAPGAAMTVAFRLDGQEFVGLNGGPMLTFTEVVSFVVDRETQEEVDHCWERLTEGGEPSQCDWLKEKGGLSWQIVPRILVELLQDEDPAKANAVMQAMLQMSKIEIAKLQEAYAGA